MLRIWGICNSALRYLSHYEITRSLRSNGVRKSLFILPGGSLCFQSSLAHTIRDNNVVRSRLPDVDIPLQSITDYCFRNAHKYSNRKALVDGITNKSYTYAETVELINCAASGFTRHGFVPGDTVMFISTNCPEYVIFYHAVISIGGTVTFINPFYPLDDMVIQAKDSRPRYIWASPDMAAKAKDIKLITDSVQTVFCDGDNDCVPAASLMTDDGSRHPGKVPIDVREKVAMLPYSSGTTGLPKGVMLTHYNIVGNVIQTSYPGFNLGVWEEGAVQPGCLPMYHMAAIWIYMIHGMAWGHTIVTIPRFEPDSFVNLFNRNKITLFIAIPPFILFLNRHPMGKNINLSSLRRVAIGAAPLGKDTELEFKRRCPQAEVSQVYGLTETSPAVAICDDNEFKSKTGSIGELVGNTEAKVLDLDTGLTVGQNEPGELLIRGPQVMKGYLNKEEATKNSIDSDGWFRTGDVCYYDSDGYFYITDRSKELIKYKGLQVPPAELEAILCSHPKVADAGVIGVPDEEAGELPRAYVELKVGETVAADELVKMVSDRVVPYKKLRGGLEFIDTVPRSPSGKILRRELKLLQK